MNRCELKRRKKGSTRNKGLIGIDFKTCTMYCDGEAIKLID